MRYRKVFSGVEGPKMFEQWVESLGLKPGFNVKALMIHESSCRFPKDQSPCHCIPDVEVEVTGEKNTQ